MVLFSVVASVAFLPWDIQYNLICHENRLPVQMEGRSSHLCSEINKDVLNYDWRKTVNNCRIKPSWHNQLIHTSRLLDDLKILQASISFVHGNFPSEPCFIQLSCLNKGCLKRLRSSGVKQMYRRSQKHYQKCIFYLVIQPYLLSVDTLHPQITKHWQDSAYLEEDVNLLSFWHLLTWKQYKDNVFNEFFFSYICWCSWQGWTKDWQNCGLQKKKIYSYVY